MARRKGGQAGSRASAGAGSSPALGLQNDYWTLSQQPLQILIFLFPILLVYELGTLHLLTDSSGNSWGIIARRLLRSFFELFGVSGYFLPGLILLVVLLIMHIMQRDPWRVRPWLYIWMWGESLAVAFPVLVLGMVILRTPMAQAMSEWLPLAGLAGDEEIPLYGHLLLSLGAGVYEELLFRLIGIALIHLILVDLLNLPDLWGAIAAVALTSVAFAMYHFDYGPNALHPFTWRLFIFYALAGTYFAAIYLTRGFGIAAGGHAVYDILVALLKWWVVNHYQ